jgi:hypothetical protein
MIPTIARHPARHSAINLTRGAGVDQAIRMREAAGSHGHAGQSRGSCGPSLSRPGRGTRIAPSPFPRTLAEKIFPRLGETATTSEFLSMPGTGP